MEAKKRLAVHWQSAQTTGGGLGEPPPSNFDTRVGAILGETLLSGIVPEAEGDTDAVADVTDTGKANV